MNIILFDEPQSRNRLKPLTLTRPISDLRLGILTVSEKWERILSQPVSSLTESYLTVKFKTQYADQNTYINATVLPSKDFIKAIENLPNEAILKLGRKVLAIKTATKLVYNFEFSPETHVEFKGGTNIIGALPSLFLLNASEIQNDFTLITSDRVSKVVNDPYTAVYNRENIFIEAGAQIKSAILNAEGGPIYIGKNAVIQEGSLIIGPAAIGENAMVAFGAKIRANTTLGPVCRVGGEVGNSIFHSYTNKAHDGFLGNSYLGAWCNLGANTNNSNLKNDYKTVKLYDYESDTLKDTDELFCGTFMGDFTKAGISTMFNTGTSVGVSCNVFGYDFQDKFIPSFSWGGKADGYESFRFEKAIEIINATMGRRNKALSIEELAILEYINKN